MHTVNEQLKKEIKKAKYVSVIFRITKNINWATKINKTEAIGLCDLWHDVEIDYVIQGNSVVLGA